MACLTLRLLHCRRRLFPIISPTSLVITVLGDLLVARAWWVLAALTLLRGGVTRCQVGQGLTILPLCMWAMERLPLSSYQIGNTIDPPNPWLLSTGNFQDLLIPTIFPFPSVCVPLLTYGVHCR